MGKIVNTGLAYIKNCVENKVPFDAREIIFALKDGLNASNPVDMNEPLPSSAEIQHRANTQKVGSIGPNQVVYSAMLGTDVGDFDFNWVGLVGHDGTLIQVAYETTSRKQRTAAGSIGNTVARSFIVGFNNAAEVANITVEAETWQFDVGMYIEDQIRDRLRPKAPAADGVLTVGRYYLDEDKTYVLPHTGLVKGDQVRVNKAKAVTPVIRCNVPIVTDKGNDVEVTYDINDELVFNWNGAAWEV